MSKKLRFQIHRVSFKCIDVVEENHTFKLCKKKQQQKHLHTCGLLRLSGIAVQDVRRPFFLMKRTGYILFTIISLNEGHR
jgi:hypothetical protein